MPSSDLTLFAKWEDVKVDITYVSLGEALETLTYSAGDAVQDYTPDNGEENYAFLGWYYDDSFQDEFVPGSLLYQDVTLYARWHMGNTSYTVLHVFHDENGDPEDELEQKTVYWDAEIGRLYSAKALQRDDYIADRLYQSIVIAADAASNVITFNYYPVLNRLIRYTVYYQDEDGGNLIDPVTLENIEDEKYVAKVEAAYVPISGYTHNVYQITKWLTTDEDENVIIFVYTPNGPVSYTVDHLL